MVLIVIVKFCWEFDYFLSYLFLLLIHFTSGRFMLPALKELTSEKSVNPSDQTLRMVPISGKGNT